jgi:3',5'-cyclic-nucleotide phosphodiesterase
MGRSAPRGRLSLGSCHLAALALAVLTACRPASMKGPAPCPADVCPTITDPRFTVVVLGAQGGIVSDDLSAYLVASAGHDDFVCLDAGSVFTGLERAAALGSLGPGARADTALRERIRGYLISHPHLDHLVGLLLAAPDDVPGKFRPGGSGSKFRPGGSGSKFRPGGSGSKFRPGGSGSKFRPGGSESKFIAGSESTLAAIRDHLFNGTVWANFFADIGPAPQLGFYRPLPLAPGTTSPLPGTDLSVETWPLNHPGGSSAFLLTTPAGDALLYLGDTGPDGPGEDRLARLWARVTPLLRAGRLRAIFIEVSYPDPRADERLFGHLTPARLHAELQRLAAMADPQGRSLRGLVVAITHIKPAPDAGRRIREQLAALPDLGVRLVFPAQGRRLEL